MKGYTHSLTVTGQTPGHRAASYQTKSHSHIIISKLLKYNFREIGLNYNAIAVAYMYILNSVSFTILYMYILYTISIELNINNKNNRNPEAGKTKIIGK